MDVRTAHELLTAPGMRFEMERAAVGGRSIRVWKNGPQTLLDIFNATAPFAEREFLVLDDKRVTYGGFRKAVGVLAAELVRRGVGRGDVVAIVLPNLPEWPVALFAIAGVGAIVASISPSGTPADLAHMLAISTARVVICDEERLQIVEQASAGLAIDATLVAGSAVEDNRAFGLERLLGQAQHWGDLPDISPPAIDIAPDAPAGIFFTSGTTGRSKGVVLSHRACAYGAVFQAEFRGARRATLKDETYHPPDPLAQPQQVFLLVAPFFHVTGGINSLLPRMFWGGRIILMRWWAAEYGLRLIEREGVNFAGNIPMIAEQLLAHPSFRKYDHSTLKQFICGGSPASETLARRTFDEGITPAYTWGMTETAGGVISHVGEEYLARPKSCGLPAPIHDLRIVDEYGVPVMAGVPGHLEISGPQVTLGYWKDAELTRQTISDGWLKTGDIAFLDSEGYCHIVDRAKDMIICAGKNIYCSEVEAALAAYPGVREVAVLGLPDAVVGEKPAAIVVMDAWDQATEPALRRFVGERVEAYKAPSRIVMLSTPLPRNAGGKVRKAELKSLF